MAIARTDDPGRGSRRGIRTLTLLLLPLLLGACASSGGGSRFRDLTPRTHSSELQDPAPYAKNSGILPFVDQKRGAVSVAINTQIGKLGTSAFYYLRLIIGNSGPDELEAFVDVSVLDAAGLRVPPVEREDVIRYAVTLAGGDPEKVGPSAVGTAAGAAAPVAALAGAGPVAGYGIGLLALLARAADSPEDNRREGAQLAHWALDHWMPTELSLAATESQAGILSFHAPRRHPLRIRVKVGDEVFEFRTQEPENP